MFDPLPTSRTYVGGDPVCYFGVARAGWAERQRDKLQHYVTDCWFVVYVVMKPAAWLVTQPRFEFQSTNQYIHSRFRHPLGRLYYYEETMPVVNRLNSMPWSVLAHRQQLGGLSQLVRRVAIEVLEIQQPEKD